MPGHLLRYFQASAVLQVRRNPGRAESVTADFGLDAGGRRSPS
jgi:hypothetical protein